ncbi:MAG: phage adaptor protein [Planctomycetota bacterium]|jgi:hypothetical protein
MPTTLDANFATMECFAEVLPHLDTAQSLAEKVAQRIDDRSYTYDTILDKLNQGLRRIAGKHLLPDLETITNVDTDANVNNIRLPRDYQRNLRWAHSTTHNRRIKIYPSTVQLFRWFNMLDQTGRIVGLAIKGRHLYYQRVPSSSETIRLNYWRYPERIDMRTEKVDVLPEHLVEPLLVSYACREIFEEIEDGIDGQKVNTTYYDKKYTEAEGELSELLGPETRLPVGIETEIDWEAYLSG